MKLKKVTITGFRSIKKMEVLLVDGKITVLIGANDHGKSNILNAIEFLNDEKKFVQDDINWDIEPGSEMSIEWTFTLSDPTDNVVEKITALEHVSAEGEVLPPMISKTEDESLDIVYYRKYTENKIRVKSVPSDLVPLDKENEVLKFKPRVELFIAPTTNLKDQVTLAQLETSDFEFMQGIFRLANIWDIRKDIFVQNDKNSKILDEASKKLTEVLNTKWNQGRDLTWKLEYTGTNGDNIVIKIQDPSIDSRYTRPSLRSSGFRTYFLLSMITYARTENNIADSYIYLFDEPGTYLHPHAQLDLQRTFESISNRTQIIYTTHSLFLINKNYPGRNRVVSKSKNGTQIDQKPFVKNWKAVRDSLGIILSNNFLIAEKTLLVEGPSDVIYILQAIKKLKKIREVDIDLNDLSIVDAGSSENYLAMAKIMANEGREIIALMDGDKKGEEIEKQLTKVCEKEIKDKKLHFLKLPQYKSIEDLFTDVSIMQKTIEDLSLDLISLGIRKLQPNLDLKAEIKKIVPTKNQTFGKIIEEKTTKMFDPGDKLSKLSIALKYEENITESSTLSEEAKNYIGKIKAELSLKNEENSDKLIFEDA